MDRNDPENTLPRRGGGGGGGGNGGGPGDANGGGGSGGPNPDTGRKKRGRPPKNPKPPSGPDGETCCDHTSPNSNLNCLGPSGAGSKPRSKPAKPAGSVRRAESAPTRPATASHNAVAGPSRLPGYQCFCGSPAGIGTTSSSGKNYYKCETGQQCGFFQWATDTSATEPVPTQVVPTKRLSSTASHCFFAPLYLLDSCDRDKILIRMVILRPGTAAAVSVLICSL